MVGPDSYCGPGFRGSTFVVFAFVALLMAIAGETATVENDRPMIGVLAEEIAWSLRDRYPELEPHSHIAASYCKFIEGGGGRPVPIWIGKDVEYYRDIMSKING